MEIKLEKFYQNVSGKTIKPGTYDVKAKELHGLGGYLVKNGHAEQLGGKVEDLPPDPEPVVEEPVKKQDKK